MKEVIVNCTGVGSPEEFWDRYEQALGVPADSGFGRNLDAFLDAVERDGPGSPHGASVVIRNA